MSGTNDTVRFISQPTVELVKWSAADADVIWAARVSTKGEQSLDDLREDPARSAGLIEFLMRNRHGSPFEHASMTFFVRGPIFMWREHFRHRIASYNEESGRYKVLEPVFYVPDDTRLLQQTGKTGHYVFEPGTDEQQAVVDFELKNNAIRAYNSYQRMLELGVAKEVARMGLPLNICSSAYVTMNARALMNFLSLRRKSEDSRFPSFPQREIEMVAERYEEEWSRLMPLTHAAFVKTGRVAP